MSLITLGSGDAKEHADAVPVAPWGRKLQRGLKHPTCVSPKSLFVLSPLRQTTQDALGGHQTLISLLGHQLVYFEVIKLVLCWEFPSTIVTPRTN